MHENRPLPPSKSSFIDSSFLEKTTYLIEGQKISVRYSTSIKDHAWDTFLQRTSLGDFEQASFWSEVKATDGWQSSRILLTADTDIVGGFQVLWRKTSAGKIGYVSRGPVLRTEDPSIIELLVDQLIKIAKGLHLQALIVHPPSRSRLIAEFLPPKYFVPDRLLYLIAATLVLDVSRGIEVIEAGMRKTTRKQIKKARRAGIRIREGDEKDIGTFFSMMLETCKRQGVKPNPSTEDALVKLWHASRLSAPCRLTIAEYEGKPISALFSIPFGNRVTLWKKGSLPEYLNLCAMQLLYHEAFEWAHARGYQYCDFGDVDKQIAKCLIEDSPLPEDVVKKRDFFNLGFGGRAMLFPDAAIHFPNKFFSWGYRFLVLNKFGFRPLLYRIIFSRLHRT